MHETKFLIGPVIISAVLLAGCSGLGVPNNVVHLAVDFVPGQVRHEKADQLRQLAIQVNPERAAIALSVQDTALSPPWEFKNLHGVCGGRLKLSAAEVANGILERWCVVVAGIGREVGEEQWLDIKRDVYVGRVQTKGHEAQWAAVPVEDEAACPCKR